MVMWYVYVCLPEGNRTSRGNGGLYLEAALNPCIQLGGTTDRSDRCLYPMDFMLIHISKFTSSYQVFFTRNCNAPKPGPHLFGQRPLQPLEVSLKCGSPIAGWFMMENTQSKMDINGYEEMRTGASHIFHKPPILSG